MTYEIQRKVVDGRWKSIAGLRYSSKVNATQAIQRIEQHKACHVLRVRGKRA